MLSGNGADESSSCVYQMLAESLVGMKFSLKNEMEGFSLCIYHEASGTCKHRFLCFILLHLIVII
jgi:hypothetical protein